MSSTLNMDPAEVAKFDRMSSRWWDPQGEFKPLHQLNPVRLNYICERSGGIRDRRILDVGCGGGLLSEAMALAGAQVTGIDAGEGPVKIARLHAQQHQGLKLEYQCMTAEVMAERHTHNFDLLTCMELLEHVPEPARLIEACYQLLKPGGQLFLSTLNRTPSAYATAILGAEYLLQMLPRGTHDYARFIRPSELAGWLRQANFRVLQVQGVNYHPLSHSFHLCKQPRVNYLVHAIRN